MFWAERTETEAYICIVRGLEAFFFNLFGEIVDENGSL